MRKFLKTAVFVLAGIAVGALFANFKVHDYRHASLAIKKDADKKTLNISDYNGRQVIAISLKNLQHAKDIEVRMDGATIQSWYPPAVKMPFYKWMEIDGGKFKGVGFGKRLPLYLTINGQGGCKEMEIIDSSNGSVIRTVHFMKGGADAGHH
ncbi:MAG: hypothetical protein A2077_04660 [Nitrospirae bacterium GWC2_46_6]|nr:MAG: hypothetical protein A2077_04660 [Nitrospirae bacterium GWC2_46_6]OGW20105.1 MAG: hypothetical protein A2Z82_05515 [Nitrospirae bacterium GWA2_46_11]OGW23746.1 MAG: hypothetical protein A2X55_10525 [Nitrospirae bacterium GWB2_47_37]HAK89344.1 hypothetical protein [Nitrospiraceae bacterium]HCL81496.1 hypothetical protein [Nitrospiraceae bacterium]